MTESERARARERETGLRWGGGEREGEGGRGMEDLSYYSPILLAVLEASSAMAIAVLSLALCSLLSTEVSGIGPYRVHPTPYCSSNSSNGHARYHLRGTVQ